MYIQHLTVATERRRLASVLGLACLLVSAAVAEAHEGHPPLPAQGATVHGSELLLSPGAHQALGIETQKVTLADMPGVVRANAAIQVPWRQQAFVTTLIPSAVEQVFVRPGDPVTAGQELARLTSLELERLQLEMLQAATELSLAGQFVQQHTSSAQVGGIAGKVLLESRKTRDEAAARLNVSSRKLRTLGLSDGDLQDVRSTGETLHSLSIRSPMSGTVAHADVRAGQTVEPRDHLFQIVDRSTVWCVADVLETDAGPVKVGQPVEITFAAVRGRVIRGKVDHVDLVLDERRRSLPVVIEIDNRDGQLRAGMSGRVEIEVARSDQAIVCPAEALVRIGAGHVVLLKRGERKYLRRAVQLGRQNPHGAEVLDGLFPGDQVVTVGRHLLASLFHEQDARPPGAASPGPTARQVHGPARGSLGTQSSVLTAQGTVEVPADGKAYASSRIDGRIRRILVGHSEPVEAGQVLAEIESLELHNRQLDLLQALAELRWKEETVERLTPLAGRVNPQAELWQVRSDVQWLRQQVESLKRRLAGIGLPEEDISRLEQIDLTGPSQRPVLSMTLPIRAPMAGRIAEFHVVPGQVVRPQDRLFGLHDLSKAWVKVFVFEEDASRVEVGNAVDLTFAADSGLRLKGRIARKAPMGLENRRLFPVWVEVDNPEGLLREGMTAVVKIHTQAAGVRLESRSPLAPPVRVPGER